MRLYFLISLELFTELVIKLGFVIKRIKIHHDLVQILIRDCTDIGAVLNSYICRRTPGIS